MLGRSAHPNPAVQRRREWEDYRSSLQKTLNQNFKLNHIAAWQASGEKVAKQHNLKGVIASIKEQEQASLQQRRAKLKKLLEADEARFKAEIQGQRETPQQQRDRMMARARSLKAAKDKRRKAYAEEQMYRRWRASQDDIRELDTQRLFDEAHRTRGQQVAERERQRTQEREAHKAQQRYWAKYMKDEEERLKKEDERKRQEATHARDALKEQIEELEIKAQQEEEQREREKQAFARQMELDAANEKQAKLDAYNAKLARAEELRSFNLDMERRRRKERAADEELEVAMVERGRARDEAEKRKAAETKEQLRGEMEAYKTYMQERQREEAQFNSELDRLTQAELDKVHRQRDQRKQLEEEARKKLMKEVHRTRWEQIMTREERRQREREEQIAERKRIDADKAAMLEEERQEELRRREAVLVRQRELQQQIRERREREAAYFDDTTELDRQRAKEQEFRRRLAQEKGPVHKQSFGRKKANWWN